MGVKQLDRNNPTPLWAQLHADLCARLDRGEFNQEVPSEVDLVTDYAVSRHTVREALRRMRASGLVVAERGRPPRLGTATTIEQSVGTLYSLFASVEASGLTQRSVVRALDVRADGVMAAQLGLEESTPLVYLERLRLAGEEPLAMDRVWMPHSVAGVLLEADFTHTSLYAELAARADLRVTGGTEHIRAVVPTAAERAQLHLNGSVGAFRIDRLGCSNGRPVEWRQTLVRGDKFTVTAQFSPSTGYHLDLAAVHQARPTSILTDSGIADGSAGRVK